ncbi:terminase endonuclease subunit [Pantoea sp. App145]|uniref:phage terminase small subunit n=1 Tax=Pantoea sp. App145 TaxID=3071567 RepID=UPI003A7F7A87
MLSPARRHRMRVQAETAQQRDVNPLRHATGYEQMLVKLNEDRRRLKKIHSVERKAELKRQLLPDYLPWVAGVMSGGRGAQDAVVMTVMIWRLDTGDVTGALEIARYALQYGLVPPDGFKRDSLPYLLAEEVASAATRAWTAKEAVDMAPLLETIRLTDAEDMPDQVRAKLHKIAGYVYRDAGGTHEAMTHLKRALQLHEGCGVKKDIERLATAMKKQAQASR